MNYQPTVNEITENLEGKLARYFGCTSKDATREQMYKAAAMTVKDILTAKRGEYKKQVNEQQGKRVYYMCMEFLLGRSLKTNLCNLGLDDENADFYTTLNQLYEKFGESSIVPAQLPIIENGKLVGAVDVMDGKAYKFNPNL